MDPRKTVLKDTALVMINQRVQWIYCLQLKASSISTLILNLINHLFHKFNIFHHQGKISSNKVFTRSIRL
jgi:hypothetical protein